MTVFAVALALSAVCDYDIGVKRPPQAPRSSGSVRHSSLLAAPDDAMSSATMIVAIYRGPRTDLQERP